MSARLPEGPRSPALVQTLQWARDPVGFLERGRARFGPMWTGRLLGFAPLVHISDPAMVREVFTDAGLSAGAANRVLEPLLGARSTFLLDGPAHHEARRRTMPAFAAGALEGLEATMRETAGACIDGWPHDRPIDVLAAMQELALEVILKTVIGVEDPAERAALANELGPLLRGMSHPILLVRHLQVELGPLTPWSALMARKRAVHARLDRLLERGLGPGALLHADRATARDELLTLIVAGHDTVATALAWTVAHLAAHPSHAARAAKGASYLDAAVLESLRLTPVLPMVARVLTEDTEIGGWLLPRGARVAPSAYLTHREPAVWGDDAAAFAPERFLDTPRPSPYAYFPFGGGARRCIGMGFSFLEMRVVLSELLARRALPRIESPRPRRRGVVLAPEGLRLTLGRRGSSAAARPQAASACPFARLGRALAG